LDVAAITKPHVFARYFWILKNSLQTNVIPKSTKTPEKPTMLNLMNLRKKASVKKVGRSIIQYQS